MKIAITGTTGVLGKYVVEELAEHNLVLIGLPIEDMEVLYANIKSARLVTSDYSIESLTEALVGVDAVVHLAAIRHKKEFKSLEDYADNMRTCENIYAACRFHGIRNIVFTSSRAVYSPAVNEVPFQETDSVSPSMLYAQSKLAGERAGLSLPDLNLKCLRLAQLMAAEEREGYMLKTFIQRADRGEPLVLYDEGVGRREYLYVRDAARAIKAALEKPEERGVFNVGSGVATSHRELAEAVSKVFAGGQLEVVCDISRDEDKSTVLMDGTKFRSTFGWSPDYTLESSLQEIKGIYEA